VVSLLLLLGWLCCLGDLVIILDSRRGRNVEKNFKEEEEEEEASFCVLCTWTTTTTTTWS
jgi:hypothetical protein